MYFINGNCSPQHLLPLYLLFQLLQHHRFPIFLCSPHTSVWYTTSAYSAVLEPSRDFPSSSDLHLFRKKVSTLLVVVSMLLETPFDGEFIPQHLSCLCICSLPHCLLQGLLSPLYWPFTVCFLLCFWCKDECLGLCVKAPWFFNTRLDDGRKDSGVERKMQKIFLEYSKESS